MHKIYSLPIYITFTLPKNKKYYIFTVKFKPGGEVQVRDIDIEPLS